MKTWLLLLCLPIVVQADARLDSWILSKLPPTARTMGPEVHTVSADDNFVTVQSAGLSMQSFGALESRPYDGAKGLRRFTYRIPRRPKPAVQPAPVPLEVIGTFINGVPLYNVAGALSYHDQNIWHVDAVAKSSTPVPGLLRTILERSQAHSPLIGFALDGYPIYGPYGWDDNRAVRSFRSSYRLRNSGSRRRLPTGEELTPAQEGPPIDAEFPNGTFLEDYEYLKGHGDLDEHNGRFAKTPEFPKGTYAYFLAMREDGVMAYPYLIGPSYKGEFSVPEREDWKPLSSAEGLRLSFKRQPWRAGELAAFAVVSPYPLLERVHEKEMHVMVISEDLADFSHIHPDPVTGQLFAGTYSFPHAGKYWIYVDHTPPGQTQTIAKFQVTVQGPPHPRPQLRVTGENQTTVSGVRATLTTKGLMQAGRDISFHFALTEASTGNLLIDLDPYLGAWGHVLVVRQEGDEVVHAHPLEANITPPSPPFSPWIHSHAMPGPSPSEIETITGFKRPGLYKIWLQVQRNGTVLAFPFVVRIAANLEASSVPKRIPGAQVIQVSSKGYSPARIVVEANKPIRLVFQRMDAQNCANRVVVPELGIDRELTPGKSVLIEIPPQKAKEFSFSCGMGMYRGSVVVR